MKILGENYDRNLPEDSDSLKTESDVDSSSESYSDLDDLISQSQKSKAGPIPPNRSQTKIIDDSAFSTQQSKFKVPFGVGSKATIYNKDDEY